MSFFDFITGRKSDNNDINMAFNNSSVITATDAYQKSRFGTLITDKMLLDCFFNNVRSLIDTKNIERRYCGMVEIDNDIIQFIPRIKQRLTNELGFKVIVLDNNSVITNKQTNQTDYIKSGSTFILLFWDKYSVKEVAEQNKNSNTETTESHQPVPDTETQVEETESSINQVVNKVDMKPLNS